MRLRLTYPWYVILLIAVLINPACTETIDIDLDSTYTRLVVEGAVTTDSAKHYVNLSRTSDYFSPGLASGVVDAMVELTFGNETIQLIENPEDPGLYETPSAFRGVIGMTYVLNISQVDVNQDGVEESYNASSTLAGGSELDGIELQFISFQVESGYSVLMYAMHPTEQRDWFGFKLIKNGNLLTNSLDQYSVISDELFDSGYFPGFPVGYLSDNEPDEAVHPGDTICLEFNCIEEAYYNFVVEAQTEIAGYYPLFSGPPSNVVSNISNGALGIFAAYSIQRSYVIAE